MVNFGDFHLSVRIRVWFDFISPLQCTLSYFPSMLFLPDSKYRFLQVRPFTE